MKKISRDIILLHIHVCHKWTSYDIWFLKCKVWLTEIFVILCHFLPVQPSDNLEYQNSKIEKSTWRYYHFTHLHHKWQSYDVWFLRYEVWRTDSFVILDLFWTFYPRNNAKNENFQKMKKSTWRYHHFTIVLQIMIICYTVPEIWCVTYVIVVFHFRLFFALLSH